jgi:hypothetical protein
MLVQHATTGGDLWWSPYAGRKIPLVVERAGSVADRLGLSPSIGDFVDLEKQFDRIPGIVVIDPRIAVDRGPRFLGSMVGKLPEWISPLVLDDPRGMPDLDPAARAVVTAALEDAAELNLSKVSSMNELDGILPRMIARVRRAYLREGRVFPPSGPSVRPPRLGGEQP